MKRKKMILSAAVLAVAFAAVLTGFAETVTNVRGSQRQNSNLVDIYYDLNAVDGGAYTVEVSIEGRTNEVTATTFSGDVGKGIAPGKNHHIVWEAGTDWRGKKGDVKAVVTATIEPKKGKPKKVQLWAGGPCWADRNIGADNPWDYGLYFWWGDTVGYKRVDNAWVASDGSSCNFSFTIEDKPTCNKSIKTLRDEGWITSDNILTLRHDAAHIQWGGRWRMPTDRELGDLCYNKCEWTKTTQNGVAGYVVRGRGNYASNSIFLPVAGQGSGTGISYVGTSGIYWSSVIGVNNFSEIIYLGPSDGPSMGGSTRYGGLSIRPVQ